MQFAGIRVVFTSSSPDAIVRRAIGAFDREDQLLHEIDLVHRKDQLQIRGDHLHECEQVDRDGTDLQLPDFIRTFHFASIEDIELGMQRISRRLFTLEHLYFFRLIHPAVQYAAHAFHGCLA